jgi:ATP-dependent RNA helicase SUPV3L1/SUV3
MKRKIIIHAGPTNSGKTYHALQRLMQAESGTYCAPLRLLAHEVYDKLSAKGITANLITGQTVIKHNKAMHIACTMEMLDINKPIDVCVLDEYQMIGDATRGWAWTRALLGVPAKEIHLTGDESAIGLIRALAEQMNEEVEVRSYERLSPLVPASSPFSNYSTAKPGDAFIAFSRKELYSIKSSIERANTGAKCCLVYGDLPPETRAEQARLFNDPNSGYNVLVGTDAIGMGLNLNIRRIVFSKVEKFDGETRRPLKVSEVKQIAGRAGRYGSIYDKGVVTAMDKHALKYIRTKLLNETTPIHRAGIFPLFDQIAMFDQFSQKKLKFSEVLEYFMKVASISNKYFLCKTRDMVGVAKALDNMTLAIKDRYVFCMAPVDTKNPTVLYYLIIFAKQFSRGIVPWTLKSKKLPDMAIEELETMYKVSELYIWLSYRFEAEFTGQARAIEYKTKCKELIGKKLMQMKAKKSHIVNNKFRI